MTQHKLNFPRQPRPEKTVAKVRTGYDAANLFHARAIRADPVHYGGHDSFAVLWSARVLQRLEPKAMDKAA